MSKSAPVSVETLPLWVTAQLVADWWFDPTDTKVGIIGIPDAVRAGGDSHPAGPLAATATEQLGIQMDSVAALASAIGSPITLAEEYERLMVGPGRTPCPPYESMWLEDAPQQRGIMMGSAAGQVLALYRRAGLSVRSHHGELPDHLLVEFEALTWCLEKDSAKLIATTLLNDHLLIWLPRFCESVVKETSHPYYRTLATLTPIWVAAIADQLDRRDIES